MNEGVLLHWYPSSEHVGRRGVQGAGGVWDRLAMSAMGGPWDRLPVMAKRLQPFLVQMGKLRAKE